MTRGPDKAPRKTGAICVICGIAAGNSRNIPVYRYRLQRTHYVAGKRSSVAIAAIALCDRCIEEKGGSVRDYSDRRGIIRHRHPHIITSVPNGEPEWHMHAGFVPGHRHAELGPAEVEENNA